MSLLCLYLLLPSLYFASIVVSAVVVVVAPFRCIVFVLSVPAAHAPVILTCLRPPLYGTALRRRPTTEFLSSFRFFVLLSGRDYLVDSLEVWWFSPGYVHSLASSLCRVMSSRPQELTLCYCMFMIGHQRSPDSLAISFSLHILLAYGVLHGLPRWQGGMFCWNR